MTFLAVLAETLVAANASPPPQTATKPPGTRLPGCTSAGAAITAELPIVKAVAAWHAAPSPSDLQGVNTTCHYQLSALAATDS